MVTFTCPQCGEERTGVRRRCYECTGFKGSPESAEKNRQASLGKKQSDAARRKIGDWQKGNANRFNIGNLNKGKPAWNRGFEYTGSKHIPPNGPVTFTCLSCGLEQSGQRKRCYVCTGFRGTPESAEKNRQATLGQVHSDETRRKIGENSKARPHNPKFTTAGLRAHNWCPVGTERERNGHIMVKCEDGTWRYRARILWGKVNGPIPQGMLIHHMNEDPLDDRLENLQMVTRAEHGKLHAHSDTMRERGAKGHACR